MLAILLVILTGPIQTPENTPATLPDSPHRTYAHSVKIRPGEVFDLQAKLDIPPGHEIAKQRWIFPPTWRPQQGRQVDANRYIGTAGPGVWQIRLVAESAQIFVLPIPNTDPPQTGRFALFGSEVEHEITFTINVDGPRPPPVDPEPDDPEPPARQVDRITYVHEREISGPSRALIAKFRELNAAGKITASIIDVDIRDGDGDVPAQFATAIAAARGKLPAAVLQAGDTVVRILEAPATVKEITEAIK